MPKLPAGKAKLIAVPAFVVAAIVASLQVNEGRRLVPYWDALGKVWTVCAGVTGPGVTPGRTYTNAECDSLEARYTQRMLANMGHCVTVPLAFHEIRAWGDFAYNVGEADFCRSTAARLLNAGENAKACRQIPLWRYAGGFDCSIKGNTVCPGIWTRRLWEQSLCLGDS